MIRKLLKLIGILLLLLIVVILFNTFTSKSKQVSIEPIQPIQISDDVIQRLSKAIQFKTVSNDDQTNIDTTTLAPFVRFLSQQFPLVDSVCEKEFVNGINPVYKWTGSDASLKPIILMAHMDVVTVDEDSKKSWQQDPFGGTIKDGFIHGRGTLDDKLSVMGILEAVNKLLQEGYKPQRTIYICFGGDEEIGGKNGAIKIVDYFKSKNIRAEYVLDEGLVITDGIVPGMDRPVALIGTSEKGYVSLELSVKQFGGHSSMPAPQTAIGILSKALTTLEQNPLPARFCEPVENFLDHIGPEMPFVNKMAFANRWLFKNIIIGKYEKSNAGNAAIRTTTAITIFKGGVKDNVIPEQVKAIVNFRIIPGETPATVSEYVKTIINDDRVEITQTGFGNEPSPVSSTESEGYKTIEKTIRQIFPDAVVAPSLVLAATDSRHYTEIVDNIYRFLPVVLTQDDLGRIHGSNEKISEHNYKNLIAFYYQLIKN